ncbi:MAG: OmpA family protein [Pseudomonadota bacterium]
MRSRILVLAVLTAPLLVIQARAEPLPSWPVSKICQSDSAPGQCQLFEQRARARVSEAWMTLPAAVQKGCVAEFRPPLDPSWRILADCIGELGVVTRVNVRKTAIEREKKLAEELRIRRQKAEEEARRKAAAEEAERQRRIAEAAAKEVERQRKIAEAAEKQRVSEEEQSFLAALEAERAEERRAAKLAAEAAKQRAKELEEQRVAAEEASFLKELAAQQKRERLAKAAAAAKAAKTTTSNLQTAAASAVGLAGNNQAAPALKPEAKQPQKTLKVALPAQPAKKAKTQPVVEKTSTKPRDPEVAICEDRLKDTAQAGSVLFAFDSADLLEEAELTLRALSAAVRACGRLKVTIEGHTDATGRISYNQGLSERRAQNVANFLINAGAKSGQVSYVGYGEKRPVASNRTSDGRAKNRRIEYRAQ